MIRPLFLSLALLLATTASAQTPPQPPNPVPAPTYSLTGPATVLPNTLATFQLVGGTKTACAWLVQPSASTKSWDASIVLTGAPGTYQIICLAVADGAPLILQASLTIGTPAPPNPPTPPTPPAPVSTGPYVAFGFYSPTAPANVIVTSTTITASLKASGYSWVPQDITQAITTSAGPVPAASTSWGQAAMKAGLPALVVIDGAGNIVGTPATFPSTEAALVSSLPNVSGRR